MSEGNIAPNQLQFHTYVYVHILNLQAVMFLKIKHIKHNKYPFQLKGCLTDCGERLGKLNQ